MAKQEGQVWEAIFRPLAITCAQMRVTNLLVGVHVCRPWGAGSEGPGVFFAWEGSECDVCDAHKQPRGAWPAGGCCLLVRPPLPPPLFIPMVLKINETNNCRCRGIYEWLGCLRFCSCFLSRVVQVSLGRASSMGLASCFALGGVGFHAHVQQAGLQAENSTGSWGFRGCKGGG